MVETIEVSDIRSGRGRKLVYIPGWTGWGSDSPRPSQCRPLLDGAFKNFGTITAIDFKGPHAPTQTIAIEMAKVIKEAAAGQPTTVFGVSYGAQMAIRALALTRHLNVNAILIDPPSGGSSLVKLGLLDKLGIAGVPGKFGELREWMNHGPSQILFNKLFLCGLSDKDPIEVPEEIRMLGDEATTQYIQQVRKDALDGQQGFPLTLCAEQLFAMAGAADDASFVKACETVGSNYGKRVVRVLSNGDNVVVKSEVADLFYNQHLKGVRRAVIGRNHADFAQFKDQWNDSLVKYL